MMSRPRSLLVSVAMVLGLAPIAIATASTSGSPGTTVLAIGGPTTTRPISPGFLGLSLEYFAIPSYAGTNPEQVDPVFVQLIRNLAGGSPPQIRIGGDTTDRTWWPVPDTPTPAGVNETLTPDWIATTKALAVATGAKLTLGINLEADSAAVAGTEADQLVAGLGSSRIEALELGNEPELYGTFDWGRSGKPGRPRGYDFADFSDDFTRIARALPPLPLAGPASGGHRWFKDVGRFLAGHHDVAVVTLHRYPLESCYVKRPNPDYPTIPHLLSQAATQTLADSVASAVKQAHAHHVPLRVDEINTVSCGWNPAVGRSFASALWALNTLFELAAVGVDGVNVHTFPGATYALFQFSDTDGHWQGTVNPEYYGLEMFAQAAPQGSQLLSVSEPANTGGLQAYATRTQDKSVRLVLINEGARARAIAVHATTATGTGTLELLTAPSLGARTDIMLGGQSYGTKTTTGLLAGPQRTYAIAPRRHDYPLKLPPATAALLTIN